MTGFLALSLIFAGYLVHTLITPINTENALLWTISTICIGVAIPVALIASLRVGAGILAVYGKIRQFRAWLQHRNPSFLSILGICWGIGAGFAFAVMSEPSVAFVGIVGVCMGNILMVGYAFLVGSPE